MRVAGVDGYRGGWVIVWIDEGDTNEFDTLPTFDAALSLGAHVLCVDMPIGLPERGYRACDLHARARLKAGRSRVFLGARRPLLDFINDFDAANIWGKATGAGVSRQLHAILPKIAEVDACMTPKRQKSVRECHPELVFHRLSGGEHLPSKKSAEGLRLRRELIRGGGFAQIDDWLGSLPGSGVKADDLLDACACALAAKRISFGAGQKVECAAETDSKNLAMEIWF